jgi:hypothetical protein
LRLGGGNELLDELLRIFNCGGVAAGQVTMGVSGMSMAMVEREQRG